MGVQLIMVDYFLTVAISAVSGMYYIDSVWHLGGSVLPATLVALAALCALNIVGIKESATVSLLLAAAAAVVDLWVIGAVVWKAPPHLWEQFGQQFARVTELSPWQMLVGYSGAWLAFSGLESISQLSPAMRDLTATPRKGMMAVVASVLLTAPALTFFSTFALSKHVKDTESERFISELGALVGGEPLKLAVVLTGSSLLLFAANTAIIGNYHVMMALVRKQLLPEALGALSHRFQTPIRAIVLSTAIPAAILVFAGGSMTLLGELYAFGLLGAFILTSVGTDILRWRDEERGWVFWVGLGTTLMVAVGFGVNLVAKPLATVFGGTLAGLGMLVALGTHSGFIDRFLDRIPRFRAPEAIDRLETTFLTVEQAAAQRVEGAANVIVASRGATRKIFKEAVDRARARGLDRVYAIYVDEVPGLFYPQLGRPTPEGLTVLEAASTVIESMHMKCVPVWALSHSAAVSVAEAAEELSCDTVVIGATQRTFLWTALRGKFIQELLRQLPHEIRLIVVG
jgi:amino acid transporter/nucleotide-binding universal stress UspA family protein